MGKGSMGKGGMGKGSMGRVYWGSGRVRGTEAVVGIGVLGQG